MKKTTITGSKTYKGRVTRFLLSATGKFAFACLLMLGVGSMTIVRGQAAAAGGGKMFATVEEAAEALISAVEKFDIAAFTEVLGPNSGDLLDTGEPVRDREIATNVAKLARQKVKISYEPTSRVRAFILIGPDDWPFPVPITKKGTKWIFDLEEGRQEIIFRRVGRNELDAMEVCRGFVEAQHEYALEKRDGAIVNQYAQRIVSSPGRQDGLAWQTADGKWGGTVGEDAARAIEAAYTGQPAPYHGYNFKVLKGQGPAAPMGQMDFVIEGAMIGGFALVASPSQYRVTGVKTFMISHDGVLYERDLGPKTTDVVKAMERFNPDLSWNPVLEDN